MKKLFLFFFSTTILVSCGTNKADTPIDEEDLTDSLTFNLGVNYSWQASLNDSSGRIEMIKMPSDVAGPFLPENIITSINQRNPEIQLVFIRTSSDTVYAKIPDATYLTQQIGSAGSSLYFSSVIYSLTEVPHIHYVNIDFKEGDHAVPGTFSRDDFKNQ